MKLADLFESTSAEQLKKQITKLSKEYSDCDDFPTARHEIKAKLDAAREKLAQLEKQEK